MEEEELETIIMVIDDEAKHGVNALSLVEKPATQDQTILMSADNRHINLSEILEEQKIVKLAEVDKEKQLILGVVLEPNTKIYRRNKGDAKGYNIEFETHTVEKASYLYMKNLNNNKATVEHTKNKVDGVTMVESWIVTDPNNDKSCAFGKEYKKGAWACVLKVHNKEQWEEYKENGTTNISLEGVFKPKKQDQKSDLESKLSMLKSIAKGLK